MKILCALLLPILLLSGCASVTVSNINSEEYLVQRRGDVISHFSPTMLAILLPTVDYSSGDGVMERIKKIFYQEYPNSNVLFNYRIAPLTAQTNQVIRRGKAQAEDMPQIRKDLKEET